MLETNRVIIASQAMQCAIYHPYRLFCFGAKDIHQFYPGSLQCPLCVILALKRKQIPPMVIVPDGIGYEKLSSDTLLIPI
ncbi:MAG TPA: hypothetical protein DCL77_10100 [Prolixibacteraceae bacterium]|nr:hypothetical protein [Prolixibacteraceae bacterium]